MVQSAYIHIPFCKSKCNYCSFVSYSGCSQEQIFEYVEILLNDIELNYRKEPLKTLYIGGGTPSLLDISKLQQILDKFVFAQAPEITIEVNPETVDFEYLCELKKIGINRISIGVQSFDDKILSNIGRIHSAQKAKSTVIDAQNAGFDNISCDFIYGLPEQNRKSFISDLDLAVNLGVSHISLYGLKIESGCRFFYELPKNLPDDDVQADMYIDAVQFLENLGYEHYEISNFCRDNKFSRHNMNYWDAEQYYGFGAAAHGYLDNVRYSNYCKLNEYKYKFSQKETENKLSDKDLLEEAVFLGLRRGKGLDVKFLNKKFNIDFEKEYSCILEKYIQTGHLKKTEDGYCFSVEGFLISNIILSEFLQV